MADDHMPPSTRLMNFVSQEQLAEARKTRGARVDDGTAQRDRSLYEILKDNKDKRDAEFNERFKHRPPKALDEDETEFLDKLEMSRREYERQIADEEAQQLQSFQAAVAAQYSIAHELKETVPIPQVKEQKLAGRKNPPPCPSGMIIKVKPQVKKAKLDPENSENPSVAAEKTNVDVEERFGKKKPANGDENGLHVAANVGLVLYSDESEEDN